ncbi:MAG: chitobiase/beta-hexosaminidase C-terminal domain-containing protein [Opitutaceae bacterium]|jgi:hypothetical protein
MKFILTTFAAFAFFWSLSPLARAQIGTGWASATENYSIQTSAGCTAVALPIGSGVGGVFNVPGPGIFRSEFRFEYDLTGQGLSSGTEQFQGDVTLNSFVGNRVTVKQTFEESFGSWSLIAIDKNLAGTGPLSGDVGGFYDVHGSPQVLLAPFTVGQTARINTILTFTGGIPAVNVYINGTLVEQLAGDGVTPVYDKVGAYVSSSGTGPCTTTWQNILFWTGGGGNGGTPVAVDTPSFSPPAGTYAGAQTVTVATTTPSAWIAYTTDGTTPTESNGVVTNGTVLSSGESVPVNASTTLNAIAFESGLPDSAVSTAAYTITTSGVLSAPTFSPPTGTYTNAQMVTITSTASGASIAYTTDGSAPTASGGTLTHGTLYTGSISIGSSTTLNAIVFESGFTSSALATAVYTIQIPTSSPAPVSSGGGGGGGAFEGWFLAFLAIAGLWRSLTHANHKRQ